MDFAFTEEQTMFKEQIIRFARKEIVPRSQEHDLKGEFDFESFRKLGDFGILGLHFPESLGGSDADVVTSALAGEALGEAGVDGGLTLSYGAHTFLCADTIFAHGTDAQREQYIPKLASGDWIGGLDAWVSRNRVQDLTSLPLVPGPRSVGIGIS
jgi:alkylation response protein AidB-like acyl-CoA dehydrogenase